MPFRMSTYLRVLLLALTEIKGAGEMKYSHSLKVGVSYETN